jgi:hypothetical protein
MKSQVVTPQPIKATNAIAKHRIGANIHANAERMIILTIFILSIIT